MTSYHISVGYNSGPHRDIEVWRVLQQVVDEIRREPTRIVMEAGREPHHCSGATMLEYAAAYLPSEDPDLTLRVIGPGDQEESGEITQFASGGGTSRVVKELLRRAFCRLVIFEMHQRGMEVNLNVH